MTMEIEVAKLFVIIHGWHYSAINQLITIDILYSKIHSFDFVPPMKEQ